MPAIAVVLSVVLLYVVDSAAFDPLPLALKNNEGPLGVHQATETSAQLYAQWQYAFIIESFEWHQRSTRLLFWVSMVVTAFGIGFSLWQFLEASRADRVAEHADELGMKTAVMTIAFKSRSLATFMMFMSLCYLVLYVTLVYPMERVDESPPVVSRSDNAGVEVQEPPATEGGNRKLQVEEPTEPPEGWAE